MEMVEDEWGSSEGDMNIAGCLAGHQGLSRSSRSKHINPKLVMIKDPS